ncbi:hypothetical protein IFR05_005554 [Cadophora sp. M221]|nr:hypothetical protein IFR05_005554 [Cadophora sp. M221]
MALSAKMHIYNMFFVLFSSCLDIYNSDEWSRRLFRIHASWIGLRLLRCYYNVGLVNASNAKVITADSTTATFGTGTFYTPFILTNTGTGATSYKGYVVRPASEWTSSETSLNCTIACRAHGMKYSMMTLGVCGCSPFLSTNGASVYITSKSGTPPDIQYPDGASPCGGGGVVPSRPNCYADAAQLGCGGLTGPGNTGSWDKKYVTGLLANAVWFDNSFEKESNINPTIEQGAYLYLACF